MRIEKLNSNKVKVTLTGDELISYDINAERLSGNYAALHSFLFSIMDKIHKETGFSMQGGQLVVEAHMAGNDGMTLIISRISGGKGITTTVKNGKKIIAKATEKYKGKGVYFFKSFDDLCSAIIQFDDEVHNSSALYKFNEQYCYLIDFNNSYFNDENKFCGVIGILREFTERNISYKGQYTRITEYGSIIAQGEQLSEMSRALKSINNI